MNIPARVSLVTLGVRDVAASTRFYQALGWELSSASMPGDVSFFKSAGAILALYGREPLAEDASVPSAGEGFRAVSIAINVADRAQVDAALEAARTAGATIVKPAEAVFWGGYSGYFADPDGHLWEVAHNPGWPLGDDGLPVLP